VAVLACVVIGLLAALTWLVLQAASPDVERHERTLDSLRALVLSNAALQRDVLGARAGLLRDYDPLVRHVEDLNRAAAALRGIGEIEAGEAGSAIKRAAQNVTSAVREQEANTELFKSRNALLQNSLAYFSRLTAEIGEAGTLTSDKATAAIGDLTSAMYRLSSGDPEAAPQARTALDIISRVPPAEGVGRAVAALTDHGRLILETLPEVDDLVDRILASPVDARARALQDMYLDVYGQSAGRADRFRTVLYAVAILLVVYLGYLFFRLWQGARVLRSRLNFEALIASISTGLIDVPRDRVAAAIDAGIARLGEYLGVDRAAVVVGSDGRLERTHAWKRPGTEGPADPAEDIFAVAYGMSDETEGWAHIPDVATLSGGTQKELLEKLAVRTWISIPMPRAGSRAGFLTLASSSRREWARDDIALLKTAAEIFANAMERERSESEREALHERLAQSQRLEAVGTLAGGIAHEFNNILGVILGSAELAMDAKQSESRRLLHQIASAAERAKRVVDQVLTFSRRRPREVRRIAAQPVIAEAVDLMRASLPPSVILRSDLRAEAGIRGDPTGLQQVVMNLCTNAAHAMGGRGEIDITLETVSSPKGRSLSHGHLSPGSYVRLTVRDAGTGMDAATLQHIFEPFFTTKPIGSGTGLGLPTVHGIVAQFGGALNVESEPGRGSTFEAFFPRVEPPAADSAGPKAYAPPKGCGETVLIVDDERSLVLIGEEMLAALGYEPVGFADSRAALSAFRADPHRFDLALLDEVMPGMTGSELAAALRENRRDMPIILMTGYRSELSARRLGEIGIAEVLAKPLRSAALAEALARHMPRLGQDARLWTGQFQM
jgi:signal transduction histidine kinase/CheY-like chemotaxis protein